MATLTHTFPESTSRSQTRTLTIPNLKSVDSVTVNTGTVNYTVNSETITFNLANGSYSRRVQTGGSYIPADSFVATETRTSSRNDLPSSISYNSNGYSGTLIGKGVTSRVVSGEAGGNKTVTETVRKYGHARGDKTDGETVNCVDAERAADDVYATEPQTKPYTDAQGYSGTLTKGGYVKGECIRHSSYHTTVPIDITYTGSVSKPDTRVYEYSQTYEGTVTRPASDTRTYQNYYQYTVTVTYIDNTEPTITLTSPDDNLTLSEGTTYLIEGSVSDNDNGDVVTVKYQLNNQPERALYSAIADGNSPILFSKPLSYRNERLYDGETDISGPLAEDTDHTITVWAEDDKGGTSSLVTRTFTVRHNQSPLITLNNYPPTQTALIDPDVITLSGSAADTDDHTVTVTVTLNQEEPTTVLEGVSDGEWTYSCSVHQLKDGENTLTITATDQYGAAAHKRLTIHKEVQGTPLLRSVARYTLKPPLGSTNEVLAWLKRETGDLLVEGEASFTDIGEAEQYQPMQKESFTITPTMSEDEFRASVETAKSEVVCKLTLSRDAADSTEAVTMLVGVVK